MSRRRPTAVVDIDTADTLREMVRYSRWPDDRIARYLGIAVVHVERARRTSRSLKKRPIHFVNKQIERNRA